jgi:hypothetical protein
MVIRTVARSAATSRPIVASSAAMPKKKNPEPPPAPLVPSGVPGTGAGGVAGVSREPYARVWAPRSVLVGEPIAKLRAGAAQWTGTTPRLLAP